VKKTKIKIYSLSTAYPESKTSIRHHFVHTLNKELVKLGLDVKAITPHLKDSLTNEKMDLVTVKRFRYLPENSEINSASIADLVSNSRFGFFKVIIMCMIFFVVTFFECLKERPDILHGQWAFPGGLIAIILSKVFRKKSVVTIHGGIAMLKKFKSLKRITIYWLNKSSLIITNSNYTKNKFLQIGVKPDKMIRVFVPPNFVDKPNNSNSLLEFRKTFADPSNKIILFVGRFAEYKGIEYLLKSILEIKDDKVHLIIAGYGVLLNKLQALTKSLGLEKKVTFEVAPSSERLGMIHGISDVFVLPSIIDSRGETEGLGLVIIEAMKSGLPVIASSVGGIIDIIKHEENGLLVKSKDPLSIAQAIQRIISDKKLKEKIIKNSNHIVKEFYPEQIAKHHFDIYKKLVSK